MDSTNKTSGLTPADTNTTEKNIETNEKPNEVSTLQNVEANKTATIPSQSHLSTAQKVFAGHANAGLMCNNLRSNPFYVTDGGASSNSSGILAKPKFSLKPSAFSVSSTSEAEVSSSATGDSATVPSSNPFLRPAKLCYDTEDSDHDAGGNREKPKESINNSSQHDQPSNDDVKDKTITSTESSSHDESTSDVATSANSNVADSSHSISQPSILSAPAADGFTFGSNIASRASQSFVFGEGLDSRVTNVTKENGTNGHIDTEEKPKVLTLEEAADEYKKQQESGPILPEVETITGEEQESNVLQINCKLFVFNNKDSSWSEKGRGLLRLNDDWEGTHSRIVMRTAGILRVILNTNIWPTMICERANQKSIRITGTESDQVHIYLITGSPSDIEHLHSAVTYRIQRVKQQQQQQAVLTTSPPSSTANDAESEANSVKRKADIAEEAASKKSRAEDDSVPKPADSDAA